jgi:hypothetical protein
MIRRCRTVTRCYVLVSSTGRVLGHHPTRKAAERQERAINLSKARKAGHKIPKRKAKRT